MGIWWLNAPGCKPPEENARFHAFSGDPDLPSKGAWTRWRQKWPWECFEVGTEEDFADKDDFGYYAYFTSDGVTMRTRWWQSTSYFFARVGNKPVTFWAQYEGRHCKEPLVIKHVEGTWRKSRQAFTWAVKDVPRTREEICSLGIAVSL